MADLHLLDWIAEALDGKGGGFFYMLGCTDTICWQPCESAYLHSRQPSRPFIPLSSNTVALALRPCRGCYCFAVRTLTGSISIDTIRWHALRVCHPLEGDIVAHGFALQSGMSLIR